jgi:predicted patatin/cPLA2 family phospholipase
MKTNNSVREARITPEEIQEQWVLAIEQALKEGKKLKPEIQTEYTQYAKATGAVYKLPVGGKKYLAITLDPDKVLRIKRNLKRGKDVTVKSDSGQRFVLTTTEPDSGVACGPTLKIALGAKVLYAVKL